MNGVPRLSIYSRGASLNTTYKNEDKAVLLSTAEVSSVVCYKANGQILPFRYIPFSSLEDGTVMVTKNGNSYSGKVLALTDKSVTIKIMGDSVEKNQVMVISKYDAINMEQNDASIQLNGKQDFILNYLLPGIFWSCKGIFLIRSETEATLILRGFIENTTQERITAETSLVAGNVRQRRQTRLESRSMRVMAAAPSSIQEEAESSIMEDYTSFNVGSVVLDRMTTVDLKEIPLKVSRVYLSYLDRAGVQYGYKFISPEFIPACSVSSYGMNGKYLGDSSLDEKQKGGEHMLLFGGSTRVTCETILEKEEKDHRSEIINFDTTIENKTQDTVNFILRYNLDSSRVAEISCANQPERKPDFLQWSLMVKPGKFQLACAFVVSF